MPSSVMRCGLLLISIFLLACSSQYCRDLDGTNYSLCRWEDGKTFYISARDKELVGGGAINGTARRVWWNNEFIIVDRVANFRDEPDGLFLLDGATGKLSGPYQEDELKRKFSRLNLRNANTAWDSMR